jgi:hypothetical protein
VQVTPRSAVVLVWLFAFTCFRCRVGVSSMILQLHQVLEAITLQMVITIHRWHRALCSWALLALLTAVQTSKHAATPCLVLLGTVLRNALCMCCCLLQHCAMSNTALLQTCVGCCCNCANDRCAVYVVDLVNTAWHYLQ